MYLFRKNSLICAAECKIEKPDKRKTSGFCDFGGLLCTSIYSHKGRYSNQSDTGEFQNGIYQSHCRLPDRLMGEILSVRQAQTPQNTGVIKYAAVINHPMKVGSPIPGLQ